MIILGVASFFRLYKLDYSLVYLSLTGILSVIGLYLLTRELFEWRLAAIASYLMAISFWHVSFSRIDSVAIVIPFILVFSFYFLWRGIKHGHLPDFLMAGIFGGIGFYTSHPYFVTPLILILLFVSYWRYLKSDFSHSKYEYAKTKFLRGFVLFALTTFIVALPAEISFWQNPNNIFSSFNISSANILKTLGIFNFSDFPLLPWPIGVFFVVGFLNELIHWLKRKHGHFSTVHTFIFTWFFVMLLPGIFSGDTPNAFLVLGTLPVVMIFTARGIWWFFDKLSSWYKFKDPHSAYSGQTTISRHEAHIVTVLVMIIFLFSIGFIEYWRYFIK